MKIREVTYDPRARAGYVYFSDKPVAKTVQHSGFINLDLDRKGGLVGIELLWTGSRDVEPTGTGLSHAGAAPTLS